MKKTEVTVNAGRQVQYELLRILAMLGVVMNHVFNYGLHIYDDFSVDVSSWQGGAVWSVLELMKLMALPSVNCYILITGYFLADRHEFRLKGIWRVWSTTWFYAVGIYLLAIALGVESFEWHELLRHATPLLSNSYWFVTSYVILLLLAPLIAWCLQRLSKRQYQAALLVGAVVCFQPFLGHVLMDRQQVLLFVYLFMIGGYIRRYYNPLSRAVYPALACVVVLVLMFAYTLYKNEPAASQHFKIFAMEYHGLVLPLSVAIFLWTIHWRFNHEAARRAIMLVAPLSFAVYIIHTQSVVDTWLWDSVSPWFGGMSAPWLPLACVAVTLAVFVLCIAMEYVRKRFAHQLFSKLPLPFRE
jgi:hypothetical protein